MEESYKTTQEHEENASSLSSLMNLLLFSSILQESKYCEEPNLGEVTEENCTLGPNCIHETLAA